MICNRNTGRLAALFAPCYFRMIVATRRLKIVSSGPRLAYSPVNIYQINRASPILKENFVRANGYGAPISFLSLISCLLIPRQSTAVLSWFLMAMALYPDIQTKAQAEIDRVVGSERLPQVSDRESLPYLMAIVREVFRWQPIVTISE